MSHHQAHVPIVSHPSRRQIRGDRVGLARKVYEALAELCDPELHGRTQDGALERVKAAQAWQATGRGPHRRVAGLHRASASSPIACRQDGAGRREAPIAPARASFPHCRRGAARGGNETASGARGAQSEFSGAISGMMRVASNDRGRAPRCLVLAADMVVRRSRARLSKRQRSGGDDISASLAGDGGGRDMVAVAVSGPDRDGQARRRPHMLHALALRRMPAMGRA